MYFFGKALLLLHFCYHHCWQHAALCSECDAVCAGARVDAAVVVAVVMFAKLLPGPLHCPNAQRPHVCTGTGQQKNNQQNAVQHMQNIPHYPKISLLLHQQL